ncbi:MAG TPA: diguanylate cyclase [Candidatus Saccharimonadales bacterium]|jgi:diguanylate cyclase (GGDEF)-like protein|nr:diguanylate cyclase [Candidatus Saccharimonadales bacterium]
MTTKKLRVLVAEEPPNDSTESLQSVLPRIEIEPSPEVTVVTSASTLLPAIQRVAPEIVFIDLKLVQPDAGEVVRRLHRASPGVPIIVLADQASKDSATQCVAEGAMDYILRESMDVANVNRVFRSALERNTLAGLTDLLRDPTTGFHNRDAFLALGARSMDCGRRHAGSLVLLCALLKNFEEMRAEFGPAAADEAIHDLGEVLARSFRGTDLLARIGEAQFAVLAEDALEPSVAILRQRVDARLTACNRARGAGAALELGVSVSYWSASDSTSFLKFLDSVETGLRRETVAVRDSRTAPAQPLGVDA